MEPIISYIRDGQLPSDSSEVKKVSPSSKVHCFEWRTLQKRILNAILEMLDL